jgi:hypothetical protein
VQDLRSRTRQRQRQRDESRPLTQNDNSNDEKESTRNVGEKDHKEIWDHKSAKNGSDVKKNRTAHAGDNTRIDSPISSEKKPKADSKLESTERKHRVDSTTPKRVVASNRRSASAQSVSIPRQRQGEGVLESLFLFESPSWTSWLPSIRFEVMRSGHVEIDSPRPNQTQVPRSPASMSDDFVTYRGFDSSPVSAETREGSSTAGNLSCTSQSSGNQNRFSSFGEQNDELAGGDEFEISLVSDEIKRLCELFPNVSEADVISLLVSSKNAEDTGTATIKKLVEEKPLARHPQIFVAS